MISIRPTRNGAAFTANYDGRTFEEQSPWRIAKRLAAAGATGPIRLWADENAFTQWPDAAAMAAVQLSPTPRDLVAPARDMGSTRGVEVWDRQEKRWRNGGAKRREK